MWPEDREVDVGRNARVDQLLDCVELLGRRFDVWCRGFAATEAVLFEHVVDGLWGQRVELCLGRDVDEARQLDLLRRRSCWPGAGRAADGEGPRTEE